MLLSSRPISPISMPHRTDWVRKVLATGLAAAALTGIAGAVPAHAAGAVPGQAVSLSAPDETGVSGGSVQVLAQQSEVATGKSFKGGERITLSADGLAFYGWDTASGTTALFGTSPDGARSTSTGGVFGVKFDSSAKLPSAPVGSLIGRVGDSGWFSIGLVRDVKAPAAGELVLAYNDVDSLRGDNSGKFSVKIDAGSINSPIKQGRYQVALAGAAGIALAAGGGCDAGKDAKPVVDTYNEEFASRRWNVQPLADGYVTINNDCMDKGRLSATPNSTLSVAPSTGDLGHYGQWALRPSTDGNGYIIQNRATGQSLGTTPASGTVDGSIPAAWTFIEVK